MEPDGEEVIEFVWDGVGECDNVVVGVLLGVLSDDDFEAVGGYVLVCVAMIEYVVDGDAVCGRDRLWEWIDVSVGDEVWRDAVRDGLSELEAVGTSESVLDAAKDGVLVSTEGVGDGDTDMEGDADGRPETDDVEEAVRVCGRAVSYTHLTLPTKRIV
eukprot:TRINITY_DN52338_c0_g1_i1.p2 TRINITY_DN52338_c0_g1~~TRINITY_DN52338_c0_g1_i1.p2  ORF type:complete len:158 (-),score=36.46 TRINITY_DN52338_c0_g1_i1:89-562(-)